VSGAPPEARSFLAAAARSFYRARVKLSARSDYAARAVLALARRLPSGAVVTTEVLGAEQGVAANYLVQILLELKARGIVRSVRGKAGGYALARSPSEITLADVLRAVDGESFSAPALLDAGCPAELRGAWQAVCRSFEAAADGITFQQLIEEAAEKEKMYYI